MSKRMAPNEKCVLAFSRSALGFEIERMQNAKKKTLRKMKYKKKSAKLVFEVSAPAINLCVKAN